MAVLKYSVLAIAFVYSSAQSQDQKSVRVESRVEGCFTLTNIILDISKEPVLANSSINLNTRNADCPCKSALMKYTAAQKKGGNTFELLSGHFSMLGKERVSLPIAVQKQLTFPDIPIHLSLSCSNN